MNDIDEFTKEMERIRERYRNDNEIAHYLMDECMVKTLRKLGYDSGCDIFDNQEKWYA